ncbi:Endonuclease/Exonuclease/phosphatase family protein [Lacunisphaera limnophila]|uniref:Endonuclease/Exonuclease/phosphatase family protein n=1 Tax=Lacunisphaera limnophila TaxID=1838286 RepID=A0A1I7PHS0_9BACT|nr:endonuclease/exonuclease/phosphatase family protein [Lacunisphaera limnophila]AOS43162.1 Endonuclease/Exonuclease/phosphatase family protein [Lacunisphaera limnophila]
MKRLILLLGLVAVLPAAAAPLVLKVMTYNLRYASTQSPHAWPDRRPVMRDLLAREAPDVIGTQEGLYGQLRDLAADLPDYEWIGLGRAGGSADEFTAIFFRRDRFEPVAFDHFWLSDTPQVIGSITWGPKYRRMASWVRLRDKATGREFEVWNTHFDHEVEVARQKSAALIRDRLAQVDAATPLVLVGDFNCTAGASRAHEILTREAGLTDTWDAAPARANADLNTFNGFNPPAHAGERIDWILARRPAAVEAAGIVDYTGLPQFPSDHFPVTATVRF